MSRRCVFGRVAAVAVTLALPALLTIPMSAPAEATLQDCVREVVRGKGAEIVCSYPVQMSAQETDELKRATREVFQEARCTVSVRIARALVEAAMTNPDHVFVAPPQPVACTVRTKEATIPVEFTFAPRVVIRGGVAVEAQPGMADVKGVPTVIAWPVVTLVNRWPAVQTGMIDVVNAYLQMLARARPQRS